MCCFDLGNHVLARLNLGRAESYVQIGSMLAAGGAVSAATAAFLRDLADFRNRLVHVYWRVTPDEVEAFLQQRLDQFEEFAAEIKAFWEQQGS